MSVNDDDNDEDWIDLTTMGSLYEEQINIRTSQRRHRKLQMHQDSGGLLADTMWYEGSPPVQERK